MRTLALASQKGGAGKSTLVVHLAVEAMNAGETVRIIDTDPQGSSIAWGDARGIEPIVEATDAGRIVDALKRAKRDGITFAIIDSAPRAERVASGRSTSRGWRSRPRSAVRVRRRDDRAEYSSRRRRGAAGMARP